VKLTPFAKAFVTLSIMAGLGFAAWHFYRKGTGAPPEGSPPAVASPGAAAPPAPAEASAPGAPAGPTIAALRARGVLKVGMDTGEPPWTGTPPMYFPDDAGNPDGFDYGLAKVLAAGLGASEVRVVHAKYSELLDRLAARDFDLIVSGYAATPTEGIAWSVPYLEYGLCLVVPAGSKVKTVADLFGKPVGIFDDDAAAEEVRKLVRGYTELVRLEDGYWDQLLAGRFAGFLYDYPYAVAEIATFYRLNPHRRGAFRIAQYNLTDSSYAVGVRSSEADLLGEVNRLIGLWRATPGYGEAIRRYLSGGEAVVASEKPARSRTVTVVAGDTLGLIARREMGDMALWPKIWKVNKARFPNPHLISPGDEVFLP
jgi:ABC-type amino acid transport substrate-binding protein